MGYMGILLYYTQKPYSIYLRGDYSDYSGGMLCKLSLKKRTGRVLVWATVYWAAVKELKLSYYIGETILFTIYTHYGNLI